MQIFILFYSFIFMNWHLCTKVSTRQPQCLDTVVCPLFLMQENREVFVVFIEIILVTVMCLTAILKYFGN